MLTVGLSPGSASAKIRGDGTSPSQYFVVFTFTLSSARSDPVSPHPAVGSILPSYLGQQQRQEREQQEGKAERFLGSHGAFWALLVKRQWSDRHVVDSWETTSASKWAETTASCQEFSLDFVSSLQLSATLLVCKILYILLLVHEPASSTLPGSLLEMQSLRPYLRPVESEFVF